MKTEFVNQNPERNYIKIPVNSYKKRKICKLIDY